MSNLRGIRMLAHQRARGHMMSTGGAGGHRCGGRGACLLQDHRRRARAPSRTRERQRPPRPCSRRQPSAEPLNPPTKPLVAPRFEPGAQTGPSKAPPPWMAAARAHAVANGNPSPATVPPTTRPRALRPVNASPHRQPPQREGGPLFLSLSSSSAAQLAGSASLHTLLLTAPKMRKFGKKPARNRRVTS